MNKLKELWHRWTHPTVEPPTQPVVFNLADSKDMRRETNRISRQKEEELDKLRSDSLDSATTAVMTRIDAEVKKGMSFFRKRDYDAIMRPYNNRVNTEMLKKLKKAGYEIEPWSDWVSWGK